MSWAAGSLTLGKVQASVLVRSLLKSERPSGLTQAIIEVGRINKTLYLLNYIDDDDIARLSRTYHYTRPLFLHAGRTGDERGSVAITRSIGGRKHFLT